jgi:hypothetical protein
MKKTESLGCPVAYARSPRRSLAKLEIESGSCDFQCISSRYVLPPEINMLMKLSYGVYSYHSTSSLDLA